MRTTDEIPDPHVIPAPTPLPRPVDLTLRALTTAADHGRLWMGIAAVGALAGKRSRRAAIRGIASLGAASFVSNSLIKPLVGRRRPDPERTVIARRIGKVPWTSSFPSGHSASAGAFATGAILELPAAAPVLVPLAAAVAYSRVHVGVHYRSDVVVGSAIGIGLALIGKRLWPVRPHGPAATAPATAPDLPGGAGLTILVNNDSGNGGSPAEPLRSALPDATITVLERGASLDDLDRLVGPDVRAVGVAGGDGTVGAVAALAQRRDLPLAVFPSGTFNHFARSLGLHADTDTVAAVQAGHAGRVDLATIDGTPFVNTAGIGWYPEFVLRRDRLARTIAKWPATALALRITLRHQTPVRLVINGRAVAAWMVFVGNGRYTPRGLAPSWREDLADGVLDVQYLRGDRRLSRTRAILFSLLGIVERSGVYGSIRAAEVEIRSESGPLPTAHDGEVADRPVETARLAVARRALTVYRAPATLSQRLR